MHNENFHPICKEPPLAHALHRFDEKTGILTYEYNGVTIITVDLKQAGEAGYRHGSDGSIQSIQYIQQIYITTEKPVWVPVTFCLSADTVNMRPHRAGSNEAILGQTSGVLIEGVNGLYDAEQDLLIDLMDVHGDGRAKRFSRMNMDTVSLSWKQNLVKNRFLLISVCSITVSIWGILTTNHGNVKRRRTLRRDGVPGRNIGVILMKTIFGISQFFWKRS